MVHRLEGNDAQLVVDILDEARHHTKSFEELIDSLRLVLSICNLSGTG